jgi:hypothetical protein
MVMPRALALGLSLFELSNRAKSLSIATRILFLDPDARKFPIPMPENNHEPRRPILTRQEQTILAFILALLIVGGIVRKVRTDWSTSSAVPVHKS